MKSAQNSQAWAPYRPRIFFMHVPKTAGMTLRLFLGNQYSASEIFPATDWLTFSPGEEADFARYRLFQGHFTCGMFDLLPQDVRPVVFLREPVARTISHLKHLRRDPEFHPAHALAAGRSLDELVHDDRVMRLCCNVQISQLSNDIPGADILGGLQRDRAAGRAPTADPYVLPPDLAKAMSNLARFHFVGFVESLQQDIQQMSVVLGLHPPAAMPKSNNDPEDGITTELSPESLAILRERNALDIAFYEAAKELPRLSRVAAMASLINRGIYAPISRPTDFAMDGPIPGSNWYKCEWERDRAYRWTGPLNDTMLDLPLAPGCWFEFSMSLRISDPQDFSIYLDDAELPFEWEASRDGSYRLSFLVPAGAVKSGTLTSIRFRTRSLSLGSVGDVRSLSFLVSELSISRVARDVAPELRTNGENGATDEPAPLEIVGAGGPSSPIFRPGRVLSDADIEQLEEMYRRHVVHADTARQQLENRLEQASNHLREVMAATRAPLLGYALQVGGSSGLFHDGWATCEMTLRLRPERPVNAVNIHGFIPDHFPDLTRAFDIEIDGELFAFWLHENGRFDFECPIAIAAGETVELAIRCDAEFNASAAGKGGDRRNLAYHLNAIALLHEPEETDAT